MFWKDCAFFFKVTHRFIRCHVRKLLSGCFGLFLSGVIFLFNAVLASAFKEYKMGALARDRPVISGIHCNF